MAQGQKLGYARVSATDQNPARQITALEEAGAERVFLDKFTGASISRPQLDELLQYVRDGDEVCVLSVDRPARSTSDLLSLLQDFAAKKVKVTILNQPMLNVGSAEGEFMLTILGAVAKLEREMTLERQAVGIALAKERGVYKRSPKLGESQTAEIRESLRLGVAKSVLARRYGVSSRTIYEVAQHRGAYA